MRFKEQVALVTGGGQGIGLAIALAFAREGAHVVIGDVDTQALDQALAEIQALGAQGSALPMDVSNREQVQQVVGQILADYGHIDILVNNAGIYKALRVQEISEAEWDRVLAVNLKGVFMCSQAVIESMKRRRQGRIINMTSIAGKTGGALAGAHYAASKAGVTCLTKSLARELAPHGITVNAIAPGRIDTPMTQADSQEQNEAFRLQTPVRRLGRPEDVAHAALFLASEEASFITGEILDVNGGLLMD